MHHDFRVGLNELFVSMRFSSHYRRDSFCAGIHCPPPLLQKNLPLDGGERSYLLYVCTSLKAFSPSGA